MARRARSGVEAAMIARKNDAIKRAEAEHPDALTVTVSLFERDTIIDVLTNDGWRRYRFLPAEENLEYERGEAAVRKKRVVYTNPDPE